MSVISVESDLRTKIGSADLQTPLFVALRVLSVDIVDEDKVRRTRNQSGFQHLREQFLLGFVTSKHALNPFVSYRQPNIAVDETSGVTLGVVLCE